MAEKKLDDLFYETLRDIYYAERKILAGLKKMSRGADDEQLRSAFKEHHDQTETHVERLQQVFELVGKRARGKNCPAIDGIVEEAGELMEEFAGSCALDAGLLASAQAVEHYEITRYGTLVAWAKQLGQDEAAKLLQQTLDEELETDKLLSQLATSTINPAAMQNPAARA